MFLEIVRDPCGEWEEKLDLDLDVNLNNILCSLQEMASTTLREETRKKTSVLHELDRCRIL